MVSRHCSVLVIDRVFENKFLFCNNCTFSMYNYYKIKVEMKYCGLNKFSKQMLRESLQWS